MANELTINCSLVYDDGDIPEPIQLFVTDALATLTTAKPVFNVQTIATTETTINLGGVTTLGWVLFVNLDDTNYVEIKTAASGTVIGKMRPGKPYGPVEMGSGVTAPVAIANSASCRVATLICAA